MVSAEAANGESAVAETRIAAKTLLRRGGTLFPSFVLHGNHAAIAYPCGSASAALSIVPPLTAFRKRSVNQISNDCQAQAIMTAPSLQGKNAQNSNA